MRWIIGVAGLFAGIGLVLLFDYPAAPPQPLPSVPVRVEESAVVVGVAPDTSAAERAACDALRDMGAAASIGDWVNVSYVLNGTRLEREAAAVRAAAPSGSRAQVYGAVLDVLEGCLRVGA